MESYSHWSFWALIAILYSIMHYGKKIIDVLYDISTEIKSLDHNMRNIFYGYNNKNSIEEINEGISEVSFYVNEINNKIEDPYTPTREPDFIFHQSRKGGSPKQFEASDE